MSNIPHTQKNMEVFTARKYKSVYLVGFVFFCALLLSSFVPDGSLTAISHGESGKRLTASDIQPQFRSVSDMKIFTDIDVPSYNNALPNPFVYDDKNLTEYKKSILTFLHNPKSGGTTLKDCMSKLSHQLNIERPLLVTPVSRDEVQQNFLNAILNPAKYNMMMGGASIGVCESFSSRSCSYFTIVREPYDRMISHYFFCKDGGESSIPCENKTIEEFTALAGSIFFQQLALREKCVCDANCNDLSKQPWYCIPDYDNYNDNMNHKDALLQYLAQHLELYFAVIGITEEYETTLNILQKTFGLPFHDVCNDVRSNAGSYGSIDKTKTDQRKSEAKRRMLESSKVQEILYPDVVLYERARELFKLQKKKLFLD